ncbi:MAG: hypothetical protein ABSA77_00740 [Thermoguttaceae bacterium]|jgi:hypothetical protein
MYRKFIVLIAICTFLSGCSKQLPPLPLEVDRDGGFRLKEISVAEAIQRQPEFNNCGARAGLKEKTEYLEDSTAAKYPRFKGPEPLYGFAKFGRDFLKSDREIKYFFALDASGADGYDTLYFDANHDLDLTNDPPLGLSKKPWPAGLKPFLTPDNRLMFEELAVPIDFGPPYGVQPVKFLPVYIKSAATMHFVPLTFGAGRIKMADHEFDAILEQEMVGGNARLDGHVFFLHIMEPGKKEPLESWPGAELGAFRFVDGKYYAISTTPVGDKLFVKPYTGELGTLKIGPGSRDIKDFTAEGYITSQTSAVPIGKPEAGKEGSLQPVAEWQVPVGDYTPYSLTLHYDELSIEIGYNFHSDGHLYNLRERPRMFPIQIRKDKPFVLDLANKPEIYFRAPEKDAAFKPGEEVGVIAVLIDPVLDIMLRGLNKNDKSLDPTVTIADSSGKTVAEGVMPFG